MPKPRRYDTELYAHFITFSCYRRRKLLDHDRAKRIVLGVLAAQLRKQTARCVGFVVMPDHAHAIVWFPAVGQLSHFMKQWKQQSSARLKRFLREKLPEYAGRFPPGDPAWQARYYAFPIYARKKLEEKLRYMHYNPVRAGLVQKPTDWRYSSARWYDGRRSVGVPIEWVE